jgi:MoaA/NifB/PqqE/SkfB family radical SAM enzyme
LDIKTRVLDETAEELLDIHRYCVEELGCDYHVFQFLKGSPIQHSDVMYGFEDILKESKAQIYERFETIKQQFRKIQEYNIEHGSVSFLHPKVGSLVSEEDFPMMDYMNVESFVKENYMACKYPWSSVHINSDGNLFTCLAVPAGNVKEKSLVEIVNGEEMTRFRDLIRREGTIEACNRCGWLKPRLKQD